MKTANLNKEISRLKDSDDSNTTKIERVFKALLSGWQGHRFNAERQLHDHCLHTTISSIEKKYHITVQRKWIKVSGFQGHPTSVKYYWIDKADINRFLSKSASGH